MTPAERSLRARMATHTGWAKTENRTERSRPGREAAFRKFEDQVDPDRKLPESERIKRAESARRAHMADIARKSVKSRKPKGSAAT
jgi:hypothetical protein